MIRTASSRFYVLVGLVMVGLAGAVLGRRPELAALTAPFLALLLVGVAAHRWPSLEVTVRSDRARAVQGDIVEVLVEVTTSRAVPWLDLELLLPAALEPLDGSNRALVTVGGAGTRVVAFPVRVRRWGVLSPERLVVVARDRFGLFAQSWVTSVHAPVRVYPADGQLGGLLAPQRTGRSLGAHLAAVRGDGCEFADVRPFRPGDRPRSMNWRVSARRGEPWVTERHPELAADIVLLLDAGTDVGVGDDTTLRRAIRAAMALAESHVTSHDRVGLCALGGRLQWLPPRLGRHQLYRVVDVLLDSQSALRSSGGSGVAGALASVGSLGRGTVRVRPASGGPDGPTRGSPRFGGSLPLRGLAPGTTVVALSPLLDRRVIEVIADLRQRGFDVVVLECSAEAGVVAASGQPADPAARLALRVWRLEREAVRHRLSAVGVPTMTWDDDRPLAAVLELLGRRRRGRLATGGRPGRTDDGQLHR